MMDDMARAHRLDSADQRALLDAANALDALVLQHEHTRATSRITPAQADAAERLAARLRKTADHITAVWN